MGHSNGRGDWFQQGKEPFDWSNEARESFDQEEPEFEYTLRFPVPADKVVQSLRLVKGELVVTYRFVFSDPEILEDEEE